MCSHSLVGKTNDVTGCAVFRELTASHFKRMWWDATTRNGMDLALVKKEIQNSVCICHVNISLDSLRFISLSNRTFSVLALSSDHKSLSRFVFVMLWHVSLKSIKIQSALSASCSLQLLSSWSSWPWWPSVTLQSPSAPRETSPIRQHLQVHHTVMNTHTGNPQLWYYPSVFHAWTSKLCLVPYEASITTTLIDRPFSAQTDYGCKYQLVILVIE